MLVIDAITGHVHEAVCETLTGMGDAFTEGLELDRLVRPMPIR